jgi:hypothetical protein
MSDFQTDVIERLARIEENQKSEREYRRDHGKRLTALERWRWGLAGAIAIVSALFTYLKGGSHG